MVLKLRSSCFHFLEILLSGIHPFLTVTCFQLHKNHSFRLELAEMSNWHRYIRIMMASCRSDWSHCRVACYLRGDYKWEWLRIDLLIYFVFNNLHDLHANVNKTRLWYVWGVFITQNMQPDRPNNVIFFQTLFEFLRYKSGIVVSLVYCISTKYCIINYDNKSFSLDAWIAQIWEHYPIKSIVIGSNHDKMYHQGLNGKESLHFIRTHVWANNTD